MQNPFSPLQMCLLYSLISLRGQHNQGTGTVDSCHSFPGEKLLWYEPCLSSCPPGWADLQLKSCLASCYTRTALSNFWLGMRNPRITELCPMAASRTVSTLQFQLACQELPASSASSQFPRQFLQLLVLIGLWRMPTGGLQAQPLLSALMAATRSSTSH